MIYRLDLGEKVSLENTGVLFYNENREIQFNSSDVDYWLPDAFGLEPTYLSKKYESDQKHKNLTTQATGVPTSDESHDILKPESVPENT